jgi:hypothetical protein
MERGLLWLPLLVFLIWLTWAGKQEYQKVESYRRWAEQFEVAKYDLYAVLGVKGREITWGKPTPTGPVDLQTFSLDGVKEIRLLVNELVVALDSPPRKGTPVIEFILLAQDTPIKIPFTEISLALKWTKHLTDLV